MAQLWSVGSTNTCNERSKEMRSLAWRKATEVKPTEVPPTRPSTRR